MTKTNQKVKTRRLFQGMGIGYVICLFTHIIAALLPMYIIFPFAGRFFEHSHSHSYCEGAHAAHSHGLFNHIVGDILVLTMVIIPVALLTLLGHKLVKYFRCKCGTVHDNDPCETCEHRKY
ncbi:MAG: hypothetical protein FWC92_02400 [Defluviitaleaceae bacterium]|nr:hypothetical protein [Defluviitaleaceae bacterium]